jgi:hypothetical protein
LTSSRLVSIRQAKFGRRSSAIWPGQANISEEAVGHYSLWKIPPVARSRSAGDRIRADPARRSRRRATGGR